MGDVRLTSGGASYSGQEDIRRRVRANNLGAPHKRYISFPICRLYLAASTLQFFCYLVGMGNRQCKIPTDVTVKITAFWERSTLLKEEDAPVYMASHSIIFISL
jgi:hypothetical protein